MWSVRCDQLALVYRIFQYLIRASFLFAPELYLRVTEAPGGRCRFTHTIKTRIIKTGVYIWYERLREGRDQRLFFSNICTDTCASTYQSLIDRSRCSCIRPLSQTILTGVFDHRTVKPQGIQGSHRIHIPGWKFRCGPIQLPIREIFFHYRFVEGSETISLSNSFHCLFWFAARHRSQVA